MPTASKVAIVGPGAIGSLIAALLARRGHNVFLSDHQQARAELRSMNGICVHDADATWHVDVDSSTNAANAGVVDLLVVCTKAFDTARAIKDAEPLLSPNTIVVSIQNGIENGHYIAASAPSHALCASTAMGALLESPATVRWTGHGETTLATLPGTSPKDATIVAAILTEAGARCRAVPDLDAMLWEKLIVNAAVNPTTAIYGLQNGQLLEHPEALEMATAAAMEAKMVADALGITFQNADLITSIKTVCRETATNRSSMLCDIEAGRKTEIDAITGYIVRNAIALGLSTPVNSRLLDAVHSLEKVPLIHG
jgi:2-dehydropantoate 2-reductase